MITLTHLRPATVCTRFLNKSRILLIAAMVLAGGAPVLAALDGFNVNSSTFPNLYNGNEIWDGANFVNDWALNGGATPASLSLSGTDLVIANDDNNGWVDHDTGSTPWEVGSGSWTVEFSAKLNDTSANNDNFVLWGTLDGQRSNITVTGTGVSAGIDSTANDLLSSVDNTDGFHTYRVAYDSDVGAAWVWRDDVELTNSMGTVDDGTTRLIIGDCCTSLGNPVDPFELRYVRYDMSGAFSPVADQGQVGVSIARETGQMDLANTTGNPITILGYSILSDAGELQPADWLSIADNYDAGNPGPNQVDPNNNWTVLTNPSVRTDLSEAELEGGDGATIVAGQSIDLGTPWILQFNEDVTFELLLDDGNILDGVVAFTGNNDMPYAFGDLSGAAGVPDGAVDLLDWNAFKAGYGTDLTGLSSAEAYLSSDLDADGTHSLLDFRAFETAFDAVNGAGAFQRMVPEPSSVSLMLLAGLGLLAWRRPRFSGKLLALILLVGVGLFGVPDAQAELTLALYDAGPAGGGPADLDPTLQGWNADEVLTSGPDQNVFFLQPDGATGFNAVQLNDQQGGTANDNPRYDVDLTPADLQNMFGFGWEFEFRWRPVEGGTFTQWGAGLSNPWSADRERVGFGVSIDTSDNSAVVSPTNGSPINLGPNSANSYHTVLAVGAPESPMYDLSIDGVFQATQDLTTGNSNSANDNVTGFQSGSSGGTGRVGNYNLQRLVVDTPDLLTVTVNTITGAARISNEFNDILDVDSYSITSASNSLTPGSWSPLEDNPAYGNGIPDDGIGFEVISATTGQLAEADLTGFATFNPNDSVNIGSIYAPGMSQDLVFTLGLDNGAILEANVAYEMGGVSGDFNMDGAWNCTDVDALVAAIASGSTDLSFDMNGDGAVTLNDITDPGLGWLAVGGANNPGQTGGNAFLIGDANLDGSTDVSDFNIWNGNKFTATAAWCLGDFNADGFSDVSDFNAWNANKFQSSDAAAVVPEPGGGMLIFSGVAVLLALLNRRSDRKMRNLLKLSSICLALGVVSLSLVATTQAEVFVDRVYHFGDDSFEGGAVGVVLGANVPPPFNDGRTLDSFGNTGAGDFQDLLRDTSNSDNAPVYVDTLATGRPGATASDDLGVHFDGDGDGIGGRELNSPNDTWQDLFTDNSQYPNNWTGIFNRGMQAWVRPEASAGADMAGIGGGLRQDVVTDTGEHGIFISDADNWGLQFDNASVESSVAAVAGQWTHVMQRTLSGAQGGALLVNGVAVAAQGTFYDPEGGNMSVGANQDLTGNFFRGDMDELTMFVWGDNSAITPAPGEPPGMDWGEIDMAQDNEWIQMQLATLGITNPADVNLDNVIDNNDVTAFVASWRSENLVNGVPVGDWISRQNGDLNYNGVVDLGDAFILHEGLIVATGVGLDFNLLIPEPSSGVLLVFGILAFLLRSSRRRNHF